MRLRPTGDPAAAPDKPSAAAILTHNEAHAAADAPTATKLVWEDLPPETRRVFLAVAMAVHRADRIDAEAEAKGTAPP